MTFRKASQGGFVLGLLFAGIAWLFWFVVRSIDWFAPFPAEQHGLLFGYSFGVGALLGLELFVLAAAMMGPDQKGEKS